MAKPRLYASNTDVPVEESRSQINTLLRDWGVSGIQWTENYELNSVMIQFVWRHNDIPYVAKMTVRLPDDSELVEMARHKRTGKVSEDRLADLKICRGWREHRVLYIFLKGSFEAIENGIITAEQLFLPWLVGRDGRTVGEVIAPRLPSLLSDTAAALLPPASGGKP